MWAEAGPEARGQIQVAEAAVRDSRGGVRYDGGRMRPAEAGSEVGHRIRVAEMAEARPEEGSWSR